MSNAPPLTPPKLGSVVKAPLVQRQPLGQPAPVQAVPTTTPALFMAMGSLRSRPRYSPSGVYALFSQMNPRVVPLTSEEAETRTRPSSVKSTTTALVKPAGVES